MDQVLCLVLEKSYLLIKPDFIVGDNNCVIMSY